MWFLDCSIISVSHSLCFHLAPFLSFTWTILIQNYISYQKIVSLIPTLFPRLSLNLSLSLPKSIACTCCFVWLFLLTCWHIQLRWPLPLSRYTFPLEYVILPSIEEFTTFVLISEAVMHHEHKMGAKSMILPLKLVLWAFFHTE